MEQLIADYIKEYLFDNSNLSIKGLGTFQTDFIPAEIDDAMKVVEPAKKKLKFAENAEYSTPAFLQFMAEKNNFSITAAEPYITRFVNTINDAINNNQPINLRGLGKFEPGLLSGLKFTPDPGVNFLRSTQSMDAVDLPNYNSDAPSVSTNEEDKATVADVLVGDLNSFKDLHNRAFNKEEVEEKKVEEALNLKEDIQNEVHTEVIEKKTVSEVLSENAKEIDSTSDFASSRERVEHEPISPEELDEERSNWLWLFPLVILLLLGMMLGQIALSDKPINEMAPFSWFSGNDEKSDQEIMDESKLNEQAIENELTENSSDELDNEPINSDSNSGSDNQSEEEINYNSDNNSSSNNNTTSSSGNSSQNSTTSSSSNSSSVSSDAATAGTNNSSTSNSGSSGNTSFERKSGSSSGGTSSSSATYTGGGASSISSILSNNPDKGFYIVTGSFGDAGNAVKRYNAIKSAGYEPVVMKNDKGLYQCMVYAKDGQIHARNMLDGVRAKFSKDAWVYFNK